MYSETNTMTTKRNSETPPNVQPIALGNGHFIFRATHTPFSNSEFYPQKVWPGMTITPVTSIKLNPSPLHTHTHTHPSPQTMNRTFKNGKQNKTKTMHYVHRYPKLYGRLDRATFDRRGYRHVTAKGFVWEKNDSFFNLKIRTDCQ